MKWAIIAVLAALVLQPAEVDESVESFPFLQPTVSEGSACDSAIDYEKGTLVNPHYPDRYESNEECTWTIRAAPGSTISLKFKFIDLEDASECGYDYITVHNGPEISSSTLLGLFCGDRVPDLITSSGNEMIVRFRSDSSIAKRGFTAMFNTSEDASTAPEEPHKGVCGGDIYADNGTINSRNFPLPYGPLEECVWNIIVPDGNLVSLKFDSLKLEYSESCSFDHVTVLDGDSPDSPVLTTVCYGEVPEIFSSKNKLTVKFSSDDSIQGPGFAAIFAKVRACGGSIVADKGVIQTPNTADEFGFRCTWRITVPDNYTVVLNVHEGEEDAHYYRFFPVHIYDGPDISSPVLKDHFSYRDSNRIRSTGNEMFIMVSSGGSVGPHFYAEFQKDICGGNIIADNGTITSRNYPGEYPASEDCTWRITVPEGHRVFLSFQAFLLEDGYCMNDFVEVRDGHSSDSPLIAGVCGENLPTNLLSSRNKMSLRFVSDSSVQYTGFLAQFRTDACGRNITAERGVITSPGFPSKYPKYSSCISTITVPEGNVVNLQFNSIGIESSDGCSYDSVMIFDGHNSLNRELLGKFCGNVIPEPIRSTTNQMIVVFESDVSNEGSGFAAEFFGETASYTELENLLRQLPNIIGEQTRRKPKPSRGEKKKSVTKRSLLDTLKGTFKKLKV